MFCFFLASGSDVCKNSEQDLPENAALLCYHTPVSHLINQVTAKVPAKTVGNLTTAHSKSAASLPAAGDHQHA